MSASVRVFLCGEGSNELGSRAGDPVYQNDRNPGVLHALLCRVQASGWEVGGARDWKRIRKYRVAGAPHADTHNVLGVALDAKEANCQVLAFSRDADTDPERVGAIEDGIARVPLTLASPPDIIGGAAVPTLEGWILALRGVRRTETMSPQKAASELTKAGIAAKDGTAMVEQVELTDLGKIPADAKSLTMWLGRAEVLRRRVAAG